MQKKFYKKARKAPLPLWGNPWEMQEKARRGKSGKPRHAAEESFPRSYGHFGNAKHPESPPPGRAAADPQQRGGLLPARCGVTTLLWSLRKKGSRKHLGKTQPSSLPSEAESNHGYEDKSTRKMPNKQGHGFSAWFQTNWRTRAFAIQSVFRSSSPFQPVLLSPVHWLKLIVRIWPCNLVSSCWHLLEPEIVGISISLISFLGWLFFFFFVFNKPLWSALSAVNPTALTAAPQRSGSAAAPAACVLDTAQQPFPVARGLLAATDDGSCTGTGSSRSGSRRRPPPSQPRASAGTKLGFHSTAAFRAPAVAIPGLASPSPLPLLAGAGGCAGSTQGQAGEGEGAFPREHPRRCPGQLLPPPHPSQFSSSEQEGGVGLRGSYNILLLQSKIYSDSSQNIL